MQYHSHIEDKLPVEFPLEVTSFFSDLTFLFPEVLSQELSLSFLIVIR